MIRVSIRGLSKTYHAQRRNDAELAVFTDMMIDYVSTELLCIVGPNGSGKSTLLKIVAGLEPSTGGEVLINSDGPDPARVSLLLQDLGLFDWKTVSQHIEFGLMCGCVPRPGWPARIQTILTQVGLDEHRNKYPSQLSGGLRQRCALARAIAFGAGLLLLDEPFSAIDPEGRIMLTGLLQRLHACGLGLIVVTHDLESAILLGDRIVALGGHGKAVRGETTVALPRPRKYADRFTLAFREALEAVESLLPS